MSTFVMHLPIAKGGAFFRMEKGGVGQKRLQKGESACIVIKAIQNVIITI